MMKEPTDFIGNILAKLINLQLANSSMREKMANWNMSVVLDTDYYPVSIIFDETISMKTGSVDEPTLIFKMSFGTIISLVKNRRIHQSARTPTESKSDLSVLLTYEFHFEGMKQWT